MLNKLRPFPPTHAFLLLAILALLVTACSGRPVLTVAPAEYDFGDITAEAPVTATLQVQNAGSGELRITGVSTSCGCTTAELADTTVAAGASSEMTVRFDPQAHPGLYGPLLRMVYLQSNDAVQEEVEIPIHVNILAPPEEPEEIFE